MSESGRIAVVDPGLLTTVQDLGRRGVGAFGVSPSGAADRFSASAANRLVGNADDRAVVETTINGATFDVAFHGLIAVTGAEAPIWIGGKRRPSWRSHLVEPGDRLVIGPAVAGLRSYLAVAGGIEVPIVLGSSATDVGGGFGGLDGRKLVAGDALVIGSDSVDGDRSAPLGSPAEYEAAAIPTLRPPFTLRTLPGPDATQLGSAVVDALFVTVFRGSARSSRQGLRLEGATIAGGANDAISAGVCAGCVQLPGDGSPIVLLTEHQTTGGYPVALSVISADIPLAAQVRPGDDVRFARIDRAGARAALTESGERLRAVRPALDNSRLGRGFVEGAPP